MFCPLYLSLEQQTEPHTVLTLWTVLVCFLFSAGRGTKSSFFLGRDISERVCAALSHQGRKPTACWSHWRPPLSQHCPIPHTLSSPRSTRAPNTAHISAVHQKTSGSALLTGVSYSTREAGCWLPSVYGYKSMVHVVWHKSTMGQITRQIIIIRRSVGHPPLFTFSLGMLSFLPLTSS